MKLEFEYQSTLVNAATVSHFEEVAGHGIEHLNDNSPLAANGSFCFVTG